MKRGVAFASYGERERWSERARESERASERARESETCCYTQTEVGKSKDGRCDSEIDVKNSRSVC
jgi:hypothetical protein